MWRKLITTVLLEGSSSLFRENLIRRGRTSMTPVVGGSKAFWTEFMQLYESLPELWNVRCGSYKNRNLKNRAYQKLVDKLKEIEPKANRETVRRKINSLRCSYRRELNKIRDSQNHANDEGAYRTTLWYFDLLGFLQEHESPTESKVCLRPPSDPVESNTSSSANVPMPDYQHPSTSEQPPPKKYKLSCPPSQNSSSHQFHHLQTEQEEHVCSLCPCVAVKDSEYDKIARAWATELRNMSPDQQIFAKRAIAEIMFEGQLGALHRDSVRINQAFRVEEVNDVPAFIIEKSEPDFGD